MHAIRITSNAVASFQRALCPASSVNHAHRDLRQACRRASYTTRPPTWLRAARGQNDGYLLLEDEVAALPLRRGRVVACLVNPTR